MSNVYVQAAHPKTFSRSHLLALPNILVTVNIPDDYVGETLTVHTAKSLCIEITGEFCHIDFDENNIITCVHEYGRNNIVYDFARIARISLVSEHDNLFEYYRFPIDTKVAKPHMLVDGWRFYLVEGWIYPYHAEKHCWADYACDKLEENFDWDGYLDKLSDMLK